ncbi:MAG: tatA [Bacteroidetes bacterium]|jgi:sec-independent protein translocase protein TatA|nr:tatA [Bacteroidota bacterium]
MGSIKIGNPLLTGNTAYPNYFCLVSKEFVPLGLNLENMTSLFVLGLLGGLGAPEIIIILVIILLMFGGKKIPELMKGLGRGVKEFKDASKGESAESTEVEKK